MDISKDSLTARAQRLQERNVSKDRSTSTSEEMEEGRDDKTFPRSTATTSDDPRSLWKPPLLEMEEERDDKIFPRPTATTSDNLRSSWRLPSVTPRTVPDSFAPRMFGGANVDADTWMARFTRYIEYRQLPEDDVVAMFPLFLENAAIDWYETLSEEVKKDWKTLKSDFDSYFGKSPIDIFFAQETLFTRVQRSGEKARDYVAQMQKLASKMPGLENDLLLWTILRGLRPQIKAVVIQQQKDIKTVADLLELAKLAESAGLGGEDGSPSDTKMLKLMEEVKAGREEVQQLSARVSRMAVNVSQPRSPTPERRRPMVSFQEPNVTAGKQRAGGPLTYNRGGRMFRGQSRPYNGSVGRQYSRPAAGMQSLPCDRCGRFHAYNRCPATNASCFNCGRVWHLRAKCRSARRGVMGMSG